MFDFPIPKCLARLLASGVWPSANGPSLIEQQIHPMVSSEHVRKFAVEETVICLYPPPFETIARARAAGGARDFWEKFGALDQIDPERALVIGDFGLGSDAPIVLDYARHPSSPPVLRLRWGTGGQGNEWVQGARDFDQFVAMLGLAEGIT